MMGGGAARVTALLCNELVKENYQIVIATNLATHTIGYNLDSRIRTISIYSINHNKDNKLLRFFYHVIKLRKAIKTIKPDIIIGEQEDSIVYSVLAKSFMSIPVVGHRHNTFKILGLSRIQRVIFNSATITVLLHNTDFCYVGKKIKNKCVIYNPCSFLTNKIFQAQKKKQVIIVGSIDRWYNKGIDLMFAIWKCIEQNVNDWKLIVVGSGNNENFNYILNLAKEKGIQENVVFTGYTNNVDDYLAQSAIFALPSRVEGFPMVLNEAVSQGCACISYELSGVVPELYSKESVVCVKDGDINLFVEKLVELMTNEALRDILSSNAIKELKKYSIENIARKWDSLFHDLKN